MGKVGKQGFSKSPPRRPVTGVKNFQRVNWGDYSVRKSLKTDHSQFGVFKGPFSGKRWILYRRYLRLIGLVLGFMGFLFLFDSLMFSIIRSVYFHNQSPAIKPIRRLQDERSEYVNKQKTPIVLYGRLLSLASKALVQKQFKHDPFTPRDEPYNQASAWKPCANKNNPIPKGKSTKSTGFILVSANGGLNQQRVAVCNAVVVASLLNATLVLPNFLYSNVWKDPSQFGDIYQEEYFMNVLKDEVDIVKDLPSHLQSLDLEALGSLITDADIGKEAKPIDFTTIALPLLNRHGIVHFLGFGNRLGFDPLSFKLQRLRCKCNFHALKFVPKIQKAGSLLVRRIRKYENAKSLLDKQLLGDFIPGTPPEGHDLSIGNSRYLALHLRFEIDMVAYSLCDFGGGELERKELQAYRETHFPLLVERLKKTESVSSSQLRKLGRCPLTPEEAGLVLAGIGFKLGSYIYLAGSKIYGGQSRMHPFSSLYPNLVTKEDLLTPSELAPFRNFSSQLAALDFIACATADVFAMTDSGSQLSSLVSGYRIYFGGGRGPTLRPNKKRLAAILSESDTLGWNEFENRVRKMIEEGQRIRTRAVGKSVYRQPRCPECMCKGS